MTISRENELFNIKNAARLGFAVMFRLDANQLDEIFETDEKLRNEYLDYFAQKYASIAYIK